MEDKSKICNFLTTTLRETRSQHDLVCLVYEKKERETEIVTAIYSSGYTREINVSMDSGMSMIRDIIRAIG